MTQVAYINGSIVTSSSNASSDVAGDTVSCAFDFTNKLFWFTTQAMRQQYGSTAWNNSSTANPATGVGGISMSNLVVGNYFPAFSDLESTSACTINTGTVSFVIPLPSGFVAWGSSVPSTITPPGAPTGPIDGTPGQSTVPLTWTAPTTGSSPLYYQVQYQRAGTTPWINGPLVAGNQTNVVVTELLPSTNYYFRVYGTNAAGIGPASVSLSVTTAVQSTTVITYCGLNIEGSNLTAISSLSTTFPNVNSVIIPVFCSTANQTSTDVVLTTTTTTIASWIQAATTAGFSVFLGVYLNPRDGSPRQTITPGPSYTGVSTFMANLKSICEEVAQLGQQNGAEGIFCGVELQPWAGTSSGDTGPFSAFNNSQWQSIYNGCKAVWPSGIISYAALQTSLGITAPNSSWSVNWSIWDAIGIDFYPGSNNTYTTTTQFQTYFSSEPDPDRNTVASVGQVPLIQALVNYSNLLGRKLIIVQCGIIPADGNQTLPGQSTVIPPPYDYNMQSAWWQAVLNIITLNYTNFTGFFAWDGGVNGYSSAYSGINYWGVQSTPSASVINLAYSTLNGSIITLMPPINFMVTSSSTTTLTVNWTAISGTEIVYVVQYAPLSSNSFISLLATTNTFNTITGLTPNTSYDIRVYGQQGAIIGPPSTTIIGTTLSLTPQEITITSPTNVTANSTFTVEGLLTNYTTAPTQLYYINDPSLSGISNLTSVVTASSIALNWVSGGNLTYLPFPSGSIITSNSFTFSHPGLAAGTHNLYVTDNTIIGSVTYTVAAAVQPTQTITINTITAVTGSTFTISGILSGFATIPSLVYSDNNGTNQSISSSGVTTTTFTFTHPAWTVSQVETVTISVSGNSSVSASATYNVTTPVVTGTAPIAVTGISATTNSLGEIVITWNAEGSAVASPITYKVYVSTSSSGPFTLNTSVTNTNTVTIVP